MPSTVLAQKLMTLKQVSNMIQVDASTIRRWMRHGQFPPPIRAGRLLRWTEVSVALWLRTRVEA